MSDQVLYTLWQERGDLDVDDWLFAAGKPVAEAAEFIRTYDGAQPYIFDRDYGAFRCFELRQYDAKSKLRVVISATVPKTDEIEEDQRRVMAGRNRSISVKKACAVATVDNSDRRSGEPERRS